MSEDSPAEEHEDARASEAKGGKQSVLEDDGDLSEASMGYTYISSKRKVRTR
ncbi:hypothetical protein EG327_007120 [Venturia inaequalis]|uniref:Uncharacterized protein n=1 Tax=Venturia inaequalis TaxID=5025 RepID=A0A8H3V1A8_VENIN|nr:hypothetical protein EG327_007120 [Venturia inaequalis]